MIGKKTPFVVITLIPLFLVLFSYYYCLGYTTYLSLMRYQFGKGCYYFVGLLNYKSFFTDVNSLNSLIRNLLYVVIVVTANFFIGLGFAVLTYNISKGKYLVRTLLVLPMLFIPASAALLWRYLYHYDFGFINVMLSTLGFPRVPFLTDPNIAIYAIMVTDIWAWTPIVYLILLAGLESLPREPLEAAEVDGASSLNKYIYIILPMMKRTIITAITLKAIDTFRAFDYVWIMTKGGPGGSSDILSTYIYKFPFLHGRFGEAASGGLIGLLVILPLIIFFILLTRGRAG